MKLTLLADLVSRKGWCFGVEPAPARLSIGCGSLGKIYRRAAQNGFNPRANHIWAAGRNQRPAASEAFRIKLSILIFDARLAKGTDDPAGSAPSQCTKCGGGKPTRGNHKA